MLSYIVIKEKMKYEISLQGMEVSLWEGDFEVIPHSAFSCVSVLMKH